MATNHFPSELLDILACPLTKSPLIYVEEQNELISIAAKLAYPIREGIAVMLIDEARTLTDQEIESFR